MKCLTSSEQRIQHGDALTVSPGYGFMAEDYIDGKGFVVILEKAINSCLIMLLYLIFFFSFS